MEFEELQEFRSPSRSPWSVPSSGRGTRSTENLTQRRKANKVKGLS